MTLTDSLGYAASFLVLLTFSMRTMVPLRIIGICSNVIFIAYAYYMHALPIMILHAILLPLNIFRLVQIFSLLRRIEDASKHHGEPNLDWMKSIAQTKNIRAGEILFRKGDTADRMFYVTFGQFRIKEIGVDLGKGQIIGELGLLAHGRKRTQTVECIQDAEILDIAYGQVRQLYFQSPKFGFYFMQLAAHRLFENLERQNKELAVLRAAAQRG
jgi:hypothetical protein